LRSKSKVGQEVCSGEWGGEVPGRRVHISTRVVLFVDVVQGERETMSAGWEEVKQNHHLTVKEGEVRQMRKGTKRKPTTEHFGTDAPEGLSEKPKKVGTRERVWPLIFAQDEGRISKTEDAAAHH